MLKPATNRIVAIDAFRGFALAGIVLVHIVEQYVGGALPEGTLDYAYSGVLNNIVNTFLFLFIRGKFFALFSILFGLSFFIQMEKGAEKGVAFGPIFLWRLFLLFLIGYLHHLFYRGDILTIYAVVGIFLLPFYRVSDRVLFGLLAVVFLGVGRYLVFALNGDDNLFLEKALADERAAEYLAAIQSGNILDVFRINAVTGMLEKMEFQLGIVSRAYLTFAFFLMGMWLGRVRFFQRLEELKPKLKKALWWSIGGFVGTIVLLAVLAALFLNNPESQNTFSWPAVIAMTIYDLNNLAMTILLLIAFCLIYLRAGGRRFFDRLAPYGRMALTNYFLQSVIGTFILFGWGLGYFAQFNNLTLLGIGLFIIMLQAWWSRWWLRRFYFGPLEWLWRCGTYRAWQPLKREKPDDV